MLTEIYEYARKLSEPFTIVELQTFKFTMAAKMVDYGLIEKALLYIEQVATNIVTEPEKYKQTFINDVYVLGDRLKYHDPVFKDSDEDVANLPWLNSLAEIVGKCEKGEIVQSNNYYAPNSSDANLESTEMHQQQYQQQQQLHQQQQQHNWNTAQTEYSAENNPPSMMSVPDVDSHMAWQTKPAVPTGQEGYGMTTEGQYADESMSESQQQQQQQHYQSYQQDYWAHQQQQQQPQSYDQQDYASGDYAQQQQQQQQQYGSMQYQSQQEMDNADHQNKWAYEVG